MDNVLIKYPYGIIPKQNIRGTFNIVPEGMRDKYFNGN